MNRRKFIKRIAGSATFVAVGGLVQMDTLTSGKNVPFRKNVPFGENVPLEDVPYPDMPTDFESFKWFVAPMVRPKEGQLLFFSTGGQEFWASEAFVEFQGRFIREYKYAIFFGERYDEKSHGGNGFFEKL